MAIEGTGIGLIAIGAGLAVGLTGLGAGMAEKDVGAAAVGAITEDQSLFGKAMIFMVLPETIVIFGLVVAILGIFVMAGMISPDEIANAGL